MTVPPLLLAVLLALPACTATFPPVPLREPLVDLLDYDIEVSLDHRLGRIDGRLRLTFQALPGHAARELLLDAAALQIASVEDGEGRALPFEHDGEVLRIELQPGAEGRVTIAYSGCPPRGLYFIPPTRLDSEQPWHVWTQGQSDDTRFWMPAWDQPNDRATHTLRLTVDAGFTTMAAGQLVESALHEGRRTDTWRMDTPHSSYLTTLVTGGLAHGALPGGDVPLPVVAEERDLELALVNLAETGEMLELFAELSRCPYPFPKYAQCLVKEYTGGGMENISATTLYYETLHLPQDEPQVEERDLYAHEAAHMWFGDLVTCRTWGDVWLNEGLATWFENLYMAHRLGPDEERLDALGDQREYAAAMAADPRPIAWHGWTDPDQTFSTHAYEGGAAVMRLLASSLGQEALLDGIGAYLKAHRAGLVTTADLQAALEASTGRDLDLFFEEWVYGGGLPEFVVTEEDGLLRVEQVQAARGWRAVFHLPVAIEYSVDGEEQRVELDIDERVEELRLSDDELVDWVRFDADTVVPMLIDQRQPESAWVAQLVGAQDAVTRLLAAEWLGSEERPRDPGPVDWAASGEASAAAASLRALPRERREDLVDETLPVLADVARRDPFVHVRVAALEALAGSDDVRATRVFEQAILDEDSRVRAAAARALGRHDEDDLLPLLLDAVHDENASVAADALAALVEREHPDALALLEETVRESPRHRWRLVNRAINSLRELGAQADVAPLLLEMLASHPVSRVRIEAAQALGAEDVRSGLDALQDAAAFRALCAALGDDGFRVRSAAARSLADWGRPALPALRARQLVEDSAGVARALDSAIARASRGG